MALITNNSLLAIGPREAIEKLKEFLYNQEQTDELLSQGVYRIYTPEKIRSFGDSGFFKFPGWFSGKVSIYDIGFGKEIFFEIVDSEDIAPALDVYVDEYCDSDKQWISDYGKIDIDVFNSIVKETEDILTFMFQSAYEPPLKGFLELAKLFKEITFLWHIAGEDGLRGTITYVNGELDWDSLEMDEDDEDDEDED